MIPDKAKKVTNDKEGISKSEFQEKMEEANSIALEIVSMDEHTKEKLKHVILGIRLSRNENEQ